MHKKRDHEKQILYWRKRKHWTSHFFRLYFFSVLLNNWNENVWIGGAALKDVQWLCALRLCICRLNCAFLQASSNQIQEEICVVVVVVVALGYCIANMISNVIHISWSDGYNVLGMFASIIKQWFDRWLDDRFKMEMSEPRFCIKNDDLFAYYFSDEPNFFFFFLVSIFSFRLMKYTEKFKSVQMMVSPQTGTTELCGGSNTSWDHFTKQTLLYNRQSVHMA